MYITPREGWVEVICGSMFAGKTEELIRRIKRIDYAKKKVLVFRPAIDNRYSDTEVVSHSNFRYTANVIEKAREIMDFVTTETYAVAIDEAQFFDDELVEVCDYLADHGVRVICAGLDKDFRGEVFGLMGELVVKAEYVTKLSAICNVCGNPATRTQRLINGNPANYNDPIVMVGAAESYEPRCRHCHSVIDKPNYER
ncbi:thymidine kinase [Mycoplasmatota bacterium]|nr:thymidine kinase [Mycoplasmatota bacterium]